MDTETLLSYNWMLMAPELIVLGGAILISVLDLLLPGKKGKEWLGWLGFAAILTAGTVLLLLTPQPEGILGDSFVLDGFAKLFKILLLAGAALLFLLVFQERKSEVPERSEFFTLWLTGLLGAMFMSSSRDLITLFVGLELLSISSYIMAGMKKRDRKSNEAAMKYVINGGVATAITLFGMSYLYGITGTVSLTAMSEQLQSPENADHLFLLGLAFFILLTGLSFKIAAAPYHMWVPDVYEGAPTSVTAFLSVVSKTAGFILIIRLFYTVFLYSPISGGEPLILNLQPYIAVLAALTMIAGNVTALKQRNVKRMLAYSSIGHAGYLLVAFASPESPLMLDAIWFYLLAYLFMNAGAFAILMAVEQQTGFADVRSFSGLYKRSPVLAVLMGIFLLSLAGIPGTAGFMAKVNILLTAFTGQVPLLILASVMIGATVISYVYYFRVFSYMFFKQSEAETEKKLRFHPAAAAALLICTAGTILFGIFPNIL
ncbi:NADH-quinone oxidoreductase subunit NuoN [Bacillus sp. FJAT-42376]|uniref:NADH-quinone oxidoreductase subunit NuoN n=1 Tax=Bacillus sp. FJAT-42376 TaxID=2014076 RepID=UPI000F4F95A6|nr:NADH-quinone oxidoreductase subunit NuoN [Bacillus sp. FJAT-42376]AZB40884.1 NADH-quinone oxidoreductase subunit NuoN [Bacillus sp. FJAT-42376]